MTLDEAVEMARAAEVERLAAEKARGGLNRFSYSASEDPRTRALDERLRVATVVAASAKAIAVALLDLAVNAPEGS